MGFTVEDMLVIAADKYDMKLVAGENGWANSISWLLMVEDTVIIRNFKGKELAVTTGLGFETEDKLLELVRTLDEHHAAGLIINTGGYIDEVPESVLREATKRDLPLMLVPWSFEMSEMIKDLSVRIFLQTQTDEKISAAFIKAIESPQLYQEYREELSAAFDVDGTFQVIIFTTEDLDSMDSVDRKRIGYRLQIYLENISHNAHFFYYDGCFVMILNAVGDADKERIISGFVERARRRMPEKLVYIGEGSAITDAKQIHTSYKRAKYAANYAMQHQLLRESFDKLGLQRLLYSVSDELICKELGADLLRPIKEYDKKHDSDFMETLRLYLKYGGSVQKVSTAMYIHKNTICYRMGKIKELLNNDLEDEEQRICLYLACLLDTED